jgi:hypothetical protein
MHLSSPSLPTGRQAQDRVSICNLNKFYPSSPSSREERGLITDGIVFKEDSGKTRKILP